MDMIKKKIAILCNYELLPERVGGMDQFFWQFDKKCKEYFLGLKWFQKPNITGLCMFLGISRETWHTYKENKKDFADTIRSAEYLIESIWVDRLGGSSPIPLLVGVWPLRSHGMALRLHNEVPGISVPDRVLDALRDAGGNAPEVGLGLARELLEQARELAAGVYVIPPFKQPEAALELFG